MKETELKPCNCSCPLPWAYETWFLGIKTAFTISCVWCGKSITRPNKKMAIKAWNKCWNRRADNEQREDI